MKGTNQKLLARTIRLTMRVALTFTLLQNFAPVYAADVDSADPSVPKLEHKFFEHTYPKDPVPQRLERIEKMVFGETKTGADSDRLAKLLQAVPQLDSGSSSSSSGSSTASSSSGSSGSSSASSGGSGDREIAPPSRSHQGPSTASGGSQVTDAKYPQVSAMEQKLLGKEFAQDPVDQRLARLESKVFGKPSSSTDLSDRVDALKSRTGVDVTQNVPNGADWADDDDTFMAPPSGQHRAPSQIAGGGGKRNLSDANSVFNRSNRSSGSTGSSDDQDVPFYGSGAYNKKNSSASASGAYGFSGGSSGSSSASGSYGFGGGGSGNGVYQRSSAPQTAYAPSPAAMPDSPSGMGLNQQVSALEQEVLNKTYLKDPLPVRVERLETNIIPKDKTAWQDKPLPDRVSHLVSIIPISAPSMVRNQRVAQGPDMDPDFPEMSTAQSGAKPAPQRSGGLSKIMNSLGSMLGGGGGYGTGYSTGYGMSGGAMVTDPQTGLMMDPNTGNLIDPSSGMVIGRRVVQPSYGSPYGMGMGGMGGYNSFNNGFSPYGGGGSSFGIGGGGIRFGRSGGMWP